MGVQEDVVTLDISMDNALRVQVLQAFAGLSNVSDSGLPAKLTLTSKQILEI